MQLGRVIGRIWATVKDPGLHAQRMLLVQPLTPELTPTAKPLVCLDGTNSVGAGELIYWCGSKESSFPFLPAEVPTNATIVGIVDELHIERDRC